MTSTFQALGIDKMGVDERVLLAHDIWKSIGGEDDVLTEEQKLDLERRWIEYKSNPSVGSPWEEVMARLRQAK